MAVLDAFSPDKSEPWRFRFARKLVTASQFVDGHRFQAGQNRLPINFAGSNLRVADLAVFEHEAKGADALPELFIGHGFEPGFNVINISKFFHAAIVSNPGGQMQICVRKAGYPCR